MVVFIGNKNKVLTSRLRFQLSRLPLSDSGYYLDNKKDAEKLDSGYYLYVLKNVYLLSTKPTCSQLSEEITAPPPPPQKKNKKKKKQKTAFKALPWIKSRIWLCSKPYHDVYPRARFKSRLSLMVWVNVILTRTVVVNSDWRFDNRRSSHLQRRMTWYNSLWLWR